MHSVDGEVKTSLLYDDNIYAELLPGQNIQLSFTLPEQAMETRTNIIVVEGHYTSETS